MKSEKTKKTQGRKSLCFGLMSVAFGGTPIWIEHMYMKGGPSSVFHRFDDFLLLYLFASIVTGILAITSGRSSRFKFGIVYGVIGVGLSTLLFLGTILMTMCSLGSRHRPLYQMEMLSSATRQYCEQNEGHLPDAKVWCDQLLESGENIEHFSLENFSGDYGLSLDPDEKRSGYAFNENLDGRKISEIDRQTVLLFKTELGWNQNGASEPLQFNRYWVLWPFFDGGYHFVFVGPGSTFTVKFVKCSEIGDLNWEPSG